MFPGVVQFTTEYATLYTSLCFAPTQCLQILPPWIQIPAELWKYFTKISATVTKQEKSDH